MQKIDINIRPSKQFLCLTLISLISSLVIISSLPVMTLTKMLLIGSVAFYLGSIIWNECLLKSTLAIHRLSFSDESWQLYDKEFIVTARLCGSSTLTGLVSILRFVVEGEKKKRSFLIFKDSIPSGFYRRLLAQLRTMKI